MRSNDKIKYCAHGDTVAVKQIKADLIRLLYVWVSLCDVTLSLFVFTSLSRWAFSGNQELNLESKLFARWMRRAVQMGEASTTRASQLMMSRTCWSSTSEICQSPCLLANYLRPSSRSINVRIHTRTVHKKYELNLVLCSTCSLTCLHPTYSTINL